MLHFPINHNSYKFRKILVFEIKTKQTLYPRYHVYFFFFHLWDTTALFDDFEAPFLPKFLLWGR